MWLFEENIQKVLEENSENTNFELKRAKEHNVTLAAKHKGLEREHNELIERFKASQVKIIDDKNDLNALQEELRQQRKTTQKAEEHLRICIERLDVIQAYLNDDKTNSGANDLKPIHENLDFKSNVVDCLEKKLTETRLKIAEQEELIEVLEDYKGCLEKDVATLNKAQPVTSISKWQDELLVAKLKESDTNLEFGKIRRTLNSLKAEILENSESKRFSTHHGDSKYIKELKMQQNESISNSIELENEADRLKIQIQRLQDMQDDITKKLYSNEERKVNLHEIRASIYSRTIKREAEINKVAEKCKELEEKVTGEVNFIQNAIDNKLDELKMLEEKIRSLRKQNIVISEVQEISLEETTKNTEENLADEIEQLQKQIVFMNNSDMKRC
ncbi:unnamed protein product [Acanthoscelides obtectus]|uniref:Uncharacterized protein n=1 Tax=Acanthoscelides obtectus TaxID=200917 RepID=A0A9P0LF44_ACAOB|nr:unnamed protein product [Acanthoscelides obtectus]CAK1640471.1 Ecotropic viral integration site 5 ortholog [Acanthoscelides obtectus]